MSLLWGSYECEGFVPLALELNLCNNCIKHPPPLHITTFIQKLTWRSMCQDNNIKVRTDHLSWMIQGEDLVKPLGAFNIPVNLSFTVAFNQNALIFQTQAH